MRKIKDEYKINKDIAGDFDVIIPNVEKENFDRMLEDNFYHKDELNSCIFYEKDILKELPKIFHLFIEVGLNVFKGEIDYKAKQINKYISIINLAEEIKNEKVKKIYKRQFNEIYNLNSNSKVERENVKSVYMIIGNNEYINFQTRFLDNKVYHGEENYNINKEYKKLLPNNSKELLFCGFVDFKQGINSNRGLNIKLEIQKKETEKRLLNQKLELEKQNKEMEKQKNETEEKLLNQKLELEKQNKEMEKQKNETEEKLLNQKLELEKTKLELEKQKKEMEDQKLEMAKQRNEFMEQIKNLKEEMKKQVEKMNNLSTKKENFQKEQEE